ncbi:hypothetical protein Tco_0438218, partial [Tanacetum coccineum]
DLRYRALKGKPLKQYEVTQMMRNLVKNQWCAAHHGTNTMNAVKAMTKQQLIEEYEYICRHLEKDRLVEHASSQPDSVPAAITHTADDPDSAGGGSSNPAASAPPMAGSAASNPAGGTFDATGIDSTVPTTAALDSVALRHEIEVSPFADSTDSSSPSNVLFESTSGVLAEIIFRGKSISGDGVVLVDRLPDDEIVDPRVKVETVSDYASSPPRTRRKHLGVRSDDCLWDKPVEDFFSSESESDDDMENYIPPLPYGEFQDWEMVLSIKCLWDKPVEDFFSSESESDDDMENYIPPLPYGEFQDWEMVSCPPGNSYIHVYYQQNRRRKYFTYLKQLLPHVYREDILLLRRRMNRYFRLNPDVNIGLDLWRDVNMLCQSLHSDDVEDFWRTQDEWIVCSWKLYPKSSVHVLDLMNGKTVYMFVDKFYPIRATLLERMLRHRLTVPPSYCRDVVVAGSVIQTVQTSLRQSCECLASAPFACTARQMVFSSPWLTAKKESGSPLQTALLASPERTATGKDVSNPLYGCDGLPKTVRVFQFTLDSCSEKLDWFYWKLLFFDVAASFDSAVHRVHAVSFDAAVASTVAAACLDAAAYFVSAAPPSSCFEKIYLETWN